MLLDSWRAVVTVLCTTRMSAPASWTRGANRFVFIGVIETAATAPPALISLDPAGDEVVAERLLVGVLEDGGRFLACSPRPLPREWS